MIEISLNKRLDYDTYSGFKDFSVAGTNFGGKIMRDHSLIKQDSLKIYIDSFYERNAEILKSSCDELNDAVSEKQSLFFEAVEKFFGSNYKDAKYKGYISIFDCNPRFVDTGEFQVCFKRSLNEKVSIAFHEVLHFIFFDFCSRNLPETDMMDKNSGKLWELSEITNVIILNLPEFRLIAGQEERLFYPDLKGKYDVVKRIWDDGTDLKEFIKKSLAHM